MECRHENAGQIMSFVLFNRDPAGERAGSRHTAKSALPCGSRLNDFLAWHAMVVLLVAAFVGCGGGGSASVFPAPVPGLFLAEITEPAGIRNPGEHWPDGKYQTP